MNNERHLPAPQPLCLMYEPLLPLLSQGQLDVGEAMAARDHVATCAWCQRHLRDFDFLRDALRRLDERDARVSDAPTYLPLSREDIYTEVTHASRREPVANTHVTRHVRQPTPHTPGRSPARSIPFAAVAAVLLIALFAGVLFGRFTHHTGATPSIGTITATISGLGAAPGGASAGTYAMAANADAVWVHNGDTGMLLRIDPRTNTIVARIQVGHGQGGVSIGQEAVWVANPLEGTVSRIDPRTNTVVATITLEPQANTVVAITASPGAVWVTDFQSDTLIRIDPQTNTVVARLTPDSLGRPTAVRGPLSVSFAAGSVWLCEHLNPAFGLTRIDPQTNQVQAQITLGEAYNWMSLCNSVVALDQAVWTVSSIDDSPDSALLIHTDPATNAVIARIEVRADPYHFAADGQGVWVISPQEDLTRIDPHTNREVGKMALPGAAAVAIGAGAVWVVDGQTGALLRITPAP